MHERFSGRGKFYTCVCFSGITREMIENSFTALSITLRRSGRGGKGGALNGYCLKFLFSYWILR